MFLTVKDGTELDKIVENKKDSDALFDFTADDGIRHTVWKISDPSTLEKIVKIFDAIPCAYVADGHHRSASNARCARFFKAQNPGHTGDEDYNWFLSVVFPAGQLSILPYNRVVRDLAGNTKEQFLEKLGKACRLEKGAGKIARRLEKGLHVPRRRMVRLDFRKHRRSRRGFRRSTSRSCRTGFSPRFSESATPAPTRE